MASALWFAVFLMLRVATVDALRSENKVVHRLSEATENEWWWDSEEKEPKVFSIEDAGKTCPWMLRTSFNLITDRWLAYYQGTMNSVSTFLVGGLYDYLGGVFGKDDRTGNMPACCADKYTVAFYSTALHMSVRGYWTRNQSSVRMPTKTGMSDSLKIGGIHVPLSDVDEEPESSSFVDFNCIMDLMRGMPFNDWLDDPDHSNSWTDLVDGVKFKTKKDWVMSWYKYYTQADGKPAMDTPKVDLRNQFFKDDIWQDGLEKAIAFDLIGSHRVQPVSGQEVDLPGSPKWVVKLNDYAKLEVRPGFGTYGVNLYFDQDGMPVLVVTPSGQQIEHGDKNWQYWKFVWRSSLIAVTTLVDHLYASHFRAANILARGVREALAPEHPLRRLLSIFTFGTIDVNSGAMHTLVGPNHALHRATAFKEFEGLSSAVPTLLPDPVKVHQHFFNDQVWDSLPEKIRSTPYYEDGRVLFKAIEKLVRRYADTILDENWCDDGGYLADKPLTKFRDYLAALNEEGHFSGLTDEMKKCKTMVDRMIAAIWQVTGWHRHVGKVVEYIDPDMAAFSWKDGESFGRPMQYLTVSVIGATTAKAQPKLSEDYTHVFAGMRKEQEAVALWKEFQQNLEDVQQTVQVNNAGRSIKNFDADPDQVECSIAV